MSGAMNKASIEAYMGESGSGKSSRMKVELLRDKPARLIIWDPKGEYAPFGDVIDGQSANGLQELVRRVLSTKRFRLIFQPQRSRKAMRVQFNIFCKVADEAREMTVVADELADVTEPNWAPEGWERLTRQGRHAGIRVMGASQSPSDLDKTFFDNCSKIAVFRLGGVSPIDRMAKYFDYERNAIAARRTEIARLADHESLILVKNPRSIAKIVTSKRDLARIPIARPL